MKQQLWILNSALMGILLAVTVASYLLHIQAPPFKKMNFAQNLPVPREHSPIKLDLFTQNDIFGTIIAPTHSGPTKTNLVPQMPALHIPQLPVPPEPKAPEFIPPLTLTLTGIIIGSRENENIVICTDETGKEGIYHLGDKIKDGTIVRITRNRLVIFRANGQQEIFYLRKEVTTPPGATPENRWTYVSKKLEAEGSFQLDIHEFTKEISSLGELIDMLGIIPIFKKGKEIGLKITKAQPEEIAPVLGLEKEDIIESINNISTSEPKNRLKLYESVIHLKDGDTLNIKINRKNQTKTIIYSIGRINRISQFAFLEGKKDGSNTPNASGPTGLPDMFKKEHHQEYVATQKDFDVRHQQRYDDTIAEIRKKLLNNMNVRAPHSRVR